VQQAAQGTASTENPTECRTNPLHVGGHLVEVLPDCVAVRNKPTAKPLQDDFRLIVGLGWDL
jgi:hypothetical protein